jgi:hypothetical protein
MVVMTMNIPQTEIAEQSMTLSQIVTPPAAKVPIAEMYRFGNRACLSATGLLSMSQTA